jgi:hypothetical protein
MSIRTDLRDKLVTALGSIKTDGTAPAPQLEKAWVEFDQCKGYPTICVVVTDEAFPEKFMNSIKTMLTAKVIGYAKDDKDCRAALDDLVEKTVQALAINQSDLRQGMLEMNWESLIADEGTKVAQPFAQFVLTLQFTTTRKFAFAG